MKVVKWYLLMFMLCLALGSGYGCSKKTVPSTGPEVGGTSDAELAARQLAESARLIMSEKVYFDFDKYDLKPESRAILDRKAKVLRDNPKIKVLLEGHCDERGTQEYNLALGDRRAKVSHQYLIRAGVNSTQLETVSYGKEQPAVQGHNEQSWALNRRDEFRAVW
ncbi:Peptidoglycan-associated lipoprotein [Desulfovibrionales bacterium]